MGGGFLGSERPIDIISVWGPPRGGTGVLEGAHLSVLDGSRKVVFVEESLRMDGPTQTVALSGDFNARVQNAAITSLASIRGREEETFGLLAGFIGAAGDASGGDCGDQAHAEGELAGVPDCAARAGCRHGLHRGGAGLGPHRRGVQAVGRTDGANPRRVCPRPRPRR